MAHSLSAKKRIRQNSKARARNIARRKRVKVQVRKFSDAVAARDLSTAEAEFRLAVKRIDQVAAKGTIHRNTAARRKSKLQKQLSSLRG